MGFTKDQQIILLRDLATQAKDEVKDLRDKIKVRDKLFAELIRIRAEGMDQRRVATWFTSLHTAGIPDATL